MIKELFNDLIRNSKTIFEKENDINYSWYLSGSKAKKTKLEKMLAKFIEDSDLDFELGIINQDEHFKEMSVAKIIDNSINNYIIC